MIAELEPSEACKRLARSLRGRANLSAETIAQQLRGWSFFDMNGAVIIQRGPEMHVAADDDKRGLWFKRGDYRALMGRILSAFGKVQTSVMDGNEAGRALVLRMGFKPTHSEPGKTYFEATELRHV